MSKIKKTRYSVERDGRCYLMQTHGGQVILGTPLGNFTLVRGEIEGFASVGLNTLDGNLYPREIKNILFSRRDFNKKEYDEYYDNSASSRFSDKFNQILNKRDMLKTEFIVKCPAWAGLKNADIFTIKIERGDKFNKESKP